jgi:anti-sigma28 factor (negative regulator of flagellin synthesis)
VYLRVTIYGVLTVRILAVPVFAAEWYQDYEKGQKAIDKGKCAEGVPHMLEALKKNPKSDLQARPYGMQLWEYIPYYYLTKCAVEQGDFAAATTYMKAAEDGNIYSSSKAGKFRQLKQTIQQKSGEQKKPVVITQPKQPPPSEQKPLPTPTEEKPGVKPQPPSGPDPEEVKRSMIARMLLDARDALNSGNYEEARSAANRVLGIDANNSEALRILNQISQRQEADQENQNRQAKVNEIRKAYRNGDLVMAENLILQFQQEYPTDRSVASILQEIRKRKDAELKNLNQEDTRKFHEKQVLLAYFSGNYEAVLQLAEQGLSGNPQSWRLYFYKGCAEAALGLLEGSSSEQRMSRAKQAFRRAKDLAGTISVPPEISPKIVEIYRSS